MKKHVLSIIVKVGYLIETFSKTIC